MMETQDQKKTVSFKDTLNLPTTHFPMQAQPKVDDPAMVARWEAEDLFSASYAHNRGKKKFILHDGPPYANGNIHLGHAYNKILKDIATKSARMGGMHVPVKPGFDCHGLPIEFKVAAENPNLEQAALITACREYAQKWIDVQTQSFKDLGVLMDWKNPYKTMSYDYESKTLQAFSKFVEHGYIERKNKTVPWCSSCKTALANAEIEYAERKDPSIYVAFPLTSKTITQHFPQLHDQIVNLLVWTTTPWTLPLNRAVLLKPKTVYAVIRMHDTNFLVAESLAAKLAGIFGVAYDLIGQCLSDALRNDGAQAHHPFIENLIIPVLVDDSVSLDDGTACVHSAPGCGPEDYEVGIKNRLEIYSPITPDGKYTDDIAPSALQGMSVADGQIWVIKELAKNGRLIFKNTITHPYPHCWRCRQGIIFRATKQWFCDLSKHGLREKAIKAIDTLAMIPAKGSERFKATLEGRLEWCLSRQRLWGVPIPAFICTGCDYTYVTPELVNAIASQVAQSGIEFWNQVEPQDFMPHNFACPDCGGKQFKREQDILDVWFDSGISHYAVLQSDQLGFPADLYLEGKDQHRGWFQSSLLTAMVIEGQPSMRSIVTHGFTVDAKGRKMSKSLGNGVSPQEMVDLLSVDGLRLWASSIDFSGEGVVSEKLNQHIKEVYRKIRNTCRFLLSNLYDFDCERDALSFDQMKLIDRNALSQAYAVNEYIINNYQERDFTAVFHKLADYCSVELSSQYLDCIKDRLYVEKADGHPRRSAQTVCYYILDVLTKCMAPILSFTAEQVSDHYQKNKTKSIHLQNFASSVPLKGLVDIWDLLKDIRSAVLKQIEALREQGIVKHSLEAAVKIYCDKNSLGARLEPLLSELQKKGESAEQFFAEFFIVSLCQIMPNSDGLDPAISQNCSGLFLQVEHAPGSKCPRCWQWDAVVNEDGLCRRCCMVLGKN